MNAEFLVASLWGVVLVYWLWTRRPFGGDSIGSFRHELDVLEQATPTKVAAAHRLCPSGGTGLQMGALAELGALAGHPPSAEARETVRKLRKASIRRRRCEVLAVLLATAVLSLLAVAVTRSMDVAGLQLVADAALAGYVGLLLRAKGQGQGARQRVAPMPVVARATAPATTARPAPPSGPLPAVVPAATRAPAMFGPTPAVLPPTPAVLPPTPAVLGPARLGPALAEPARLGPALAGPAMAGGHYGEGTSGGQHDQTSAVQDDIELDGYRGAHLLSASRAGRLRWAPSFQDEGEPYGDFGSYASLALAKAN